MIRALESAGYRRRRKKIPAQRSSGRVRHLPTTDFCGHTARQLLVLRLPDVAAVAPRSASARAVAAAPALRGTTGAGPVVNGYYPAGGERNRKAAQPRGRGVTARSSGLRRPGMRNSRRLSSRENTDIRSQPGPGHRLGRRPAPIGSKRKPPTPRRTFAEARPNAYPPAHITASSDHRLPTTAYFPE